MEKIVYHDILRQDMEGATDRLFTLLGIGPIVMAVDHEGVLAPEAIDARNPDTAHGQHIHRQSPYALTLQEILANIEQRFCLGGNTPHKLTVTTAGEAIWSHARALRRDGENEKLATESMLSAQGICPPNGTHVKFSGLHDAHGLLTREPATIIVVNNNHASAMYVLGEIAKRGGNADHRCASVVVPTYTGKPSQDPRTINQLLLRQLSSLQPTRFSHMFGNEVDLSARITAGNVLRADPDFRVHTRDSLTSAPNQRVQAAIRQTIGD